MSRKEASPAASRAATWKSRSKWIAGGLTVLAACVSIKFIGGNDSASAQAPIISRKAPARPAPATAPEAQAAEKPKVTTVAVVNGEEIQRQELGEECLDLYGAEILDGLVNKHLIALYCKQQKIVVTKADVDAEIERVASRFKLPKDEWLRMLEQERGITAEQYGEDIIWPTLALRKLSVGQLTATDEEIREAFESQFGEAVRARLIVLNDPKVAAEVHAKVKANPESFARMAHEHSVDVNSASAAGLIQPIRRHVGDKEIERAAFSLKSGGVSEIIPVGNQFVILKCEGRVPAQTNIAEESVRAPLIESIKERKLRSVAADVFEKMQAEAKIEKIFSDPEKRKEMPGVAAVMNGHKISVQELAEQTIDRHGLKILDGIINRRLLEQELKRRQLTITQQDIDAEVARAAIQMGKVTKTGEADIQAWLEIATEQQGLTIEQYVRDAVWPSAALKKLVGEQVAITQEDLQKGFEANYGPRARCRAIVLPNQRKAQEVWEMARNALASSDYNGVVEKFAKLAKEYSIETSSRDLGGMVPPIQRHGGQPTIEEEAFKLQRGELSSIIQAGDKYIVLFSEGYTEPTKVEFAEVEPIIREDLQEKKLRIAMASEFNRLKEIATIDNYLAGTTQSPKRNVAVPAPRSGMVPAAARAVVPAGHTTPAAKR